jgi:hypothetical protein
VSICLTAGALAATLQATAFTLVWTHSVQKTEWQEDWQLTPRGLQITMARVMGSGAGMDPPPEAKRRDDWWEWAPQRPPLGELVLGNSGAAGEWRVCTAGDCRTLSQVMGGPIGPHVTLVKACPVQ